MAFTMACQFYSQHYTHNSIESMKCVKAPTFSMNLSKEICVRERETPMQVHLFGKSIETCVCVIIFQQNFSSLFKMCVVYKHLTRA